MMHLGLLSGAPEPPAIVRDVVRATVSAPAGGVLRRAAELGDPIRRGDLVATIADLLGLPRAEVVSPCDGFVAALRLTGAIAPGEQVAVIFQPRDEPDGDEQLERA